MSFFYQQTKAQAARVRTVKSGKPNGIPTDTLQQMGCGGCPRNSDRSLRNPKIKPSMAEYPLIYLLDDAPSAEDDRNGEFFTDRKHKVLLNQIPARVFERDVRLGALTQCFSSDPEKTALVAGTCCRSRVVADIEETKPVVVIGIGPHVLQWATGLGGGVGIRRGRLIATRIGEHACWFMAIPNSDWIASKKGKYRKSEHELVYEHDLKWIQRLLDDGLGYPEMPEGPVDAGIEYITGQDGKDLERLEDAFHSMLQLPSVAIDFETNALKPTSLTDPKLYLASIGTFDKTYAFCLDHPEGWLTPQKRRRAWGAFGEFLLYSNQKIAHNLHLEHSWASHFFGPEIMRRSEWADSMAQAHTLDERSGTLNLDDNIRYEFGFFLKAESSVDPVRLLEYPLLPGNAPRRSSMRYNGLDTKWTHALFHKRKHLIEQNPKYKAEYDRKVRLCSTLVMTEEKGLPVDLAYAQEMSDKFTKEAKVLEGKISRCPEVKKFEARFHRFDPGNPDQVFKLMREICKRDEVVVAADSRRGSEERETTGTDVLSKIPKDEVPSAHMILELRQVEKLLSTYVAPILDGKLISPDGLIHATYNSMRTVTGRLAATDPNVQNYPKRKYAEIRGVICAPEHHIFMAADYGQVEARVIGMASEDKNLVKYLWTGYDIHGYWADRILKEEPAWKDYLIGMFGVNGDDMKLIRKLGRQEAKNKWVFPQFFGSSFRSCSQDLGISMDVAEDLANEFWDEFQGVKKWQDKLLQFYEKNLYVETLTGRRRRWAMTKNEIINMPIQGTASDIVTEAMMALSERSLLEGNPHLQPNLNVHDDLSGLPPIEGLTDHIHEVVTEMCKPRFDFINVPLIVEVSTGARWNELKEVGVFRSDELFSIPNPFKGKP